jgi:hypothetical protein
MGIFRRLKMGWRLTMDSVRVLRKEPSLAAFPIISALAGIAFLTLILGGSFVFTGFESQAVTYGTLFVLYVALTFVASFFNAAMVYNAREVFEGGSPTLKEGMAAAWRHKTTLFGWAVVAATVGLVLRAIESNDNLVARIAAMFFSVAWSIITYFIVPVIVFEDVGFVEMFKRSGATFKETWGETAGANFGIGLITAGLTLLGLAIAAVAFFALGGSGAGMVVGIAIGAAVVLTMFVVGSALGAIAKTALYYYATEGKRPTEFENVDFASGGT